MINDALIFRLLTVLTMLIIMMNSLLKILRKYVVGKIGHRIQYIESIEEIYRIVL